MRAARSALGMLRLVSRPTPIALDRDIALAAIDKAQSRRRHRRTSAQFGKDKLTRRRADCRRVDGPDKLRRVTEVGPIDVVAQVLADDGSTGLALDRDADALPDLLPLGDGLTQVADGCMASDREVGLLRRRQSI